MLFFPFSEDEFQTLQNNFLEKYYHEFDDSEENKFIYTDIHQEYVSIIYLLYILLNSNLLSVLQPNDFKPLHSC